MKPATIATLILLLLATPAWSTGLPAPLQAEVDIQTVCEGPTWLLFTHGGLGAPWVGVEGHCQSLGLAVPVIWACNPQTGVRVVLRGGLDDTWRLASEFATTLTDRALCR